MARMRMIRWLTHPARVAPAGYLVGWCVGTVLLMLPVSSASGKATGWWEASFTAMSALCVTGLAVVDTATYWSVFGQVVILALIHVGGFGIMTLTSLILFSVARRVSRGAANLASAETKARTFQGIRSLPRRIFVIMIAMEAVIAVLLTFAFRRHTDDWGTATWYGVFHAISAFNNAGFALFSTSLVSFNADAFVMLPICAAIVAGGLGFPVYLELLASRVARSRGWSVHFRITLIGTAVLLVIGFLTFVVFEWSNPATLGPASWEGKVLGAVGGTVFPRTAGFNSVDYALVSDETIAVNFGLMMIGGGSGGTAGGLRIGTVAVLVLAVLAELRGERDAVFRNRALSGAVARQAFTVVVLATGAVFTGLLLISSFSEAPLREVTFEAISAFGTVGLSMNLTPTLPPAAWGVLMWLMFIGRVGPISVAAALAVTDRHRQFSLPQEDPLVG